MMLKNIFMAGVLGILTIGSGMATSNNLPVSLETKGKMELVTYYEVSTFCERHPHRCHPHPYYWYHEDYREHAHFCRHHPYSERCERFCHLNHHVCFG